MEKPSAILLLSCPDRKGIVAKISDFIFTNNGNILHADQYTAKPESILFMRIEWDLEGFAIPRENIREAFEPLARQFQMEWTVRFTDFTPRIAIFVSKHLHCFHDLVLRHRMGELKAEIPLVISNHLDLKPLAEQFGLAFKFYPISPETKTRQEIGEMEDLKKHKINLVILARYMQVLSSDFVKHYRYRIINIHHSFLPAFAGSKPYEQAYKRGVKIIGATSHYVTEDLDEGPIIAQDVIKVTHRDSAEDMMLKGKDIERVVLAKAVKLHLENRILVYGSKTIVFE
ncbi:MAG: formyltetrahydrofolate deformylase [Syntrophales bacterium]|jgi:formyltetrahydrofolate deformylase|nr:formyltetrahydrofolate deformylase [Syntrophales bacterium]MDY0043973.1 formyltetrahydrofolate deformylase [Syntrophales bacterium]